MNRFADYEVVQDKDGVVTLSGQELLHYKMCKKIAQLTKVIHHLYCKSEDQEFEVKKLIVSYDYQLDEIIRTSATKVEELKRQIIIKEGAIEETKRVTQEEKNKGLLALEAFKKKASEKESGIQVAFQAKLDEQIQILEETKTKYEAELSLLRESTNEKERLHKIEKEQILFSLQQEQQQRELEYTSSIHTLSNTGEEQRQRIASLEEELRETKLLFQDEKKNIELSFQQEKRRLSDALNATTTGLNSEGLEKQRLQDTAHLLNNQICDLQSSLEAIHKQQEEYCIQISLKDKENTMLKENCSHLEDVTNSQTNLIKELESKISSLSSQLSSLEKSYSSFLQENEKQQGDLDQLAKKKEVLIEDIHKKESRIQHLQELSNSQQTTISSLISDIQSLRNEENRLKKVQEDLSQKNQKLEEYLEQLESNRLKTLEELNSKEISMNSFANEMEMKIKLLEESHSRYLKELENSHEKQVKELEDRISFEFTQKQQFLHEKENVIKQLEERGDISSLLEKTEARFKEAEEEYRERVTRINISHTDEVIRLKTEIKYRDEQLQDLQNRSISQTIKSEELEKSLQSEIEDLKLTLSNSKKSNTELLIKLEEERENAISKHSVEIENIRQEYELRLREREDELRAVFLSQLEKQKKISADEVSAAKDSIISGLKSNIRSLEDRDIESKKKITELLLSQEDLEKRMKEEMLKLSKEHEQEIETLNNSFADSLQQEKFNFAKEKENLSLQFEDQIQAHNSNSLLSKNQQEEMIENIKKSYDLRINDLHASINNLKQDLHAKLLKEKSSLQEEYNIIINNLKKSADLLKLEIQNRDQQIENIKKEMKETMNILEITKQELTASKQEILDIRKEASKQLIELEKILNQKWEDLLSSEKEKIQSKMDDTTENLNKHIDQLEDFNLKLRESLQKEKIRYENRESRTEDVEIIKRLTSDIQDLRKKLEQLREQNKLFKLEITNREDNLNKLFGNVPKVGMLNPLGASKPFSTSETKIAKSTKLKLSSSVSKNTFPHLNTSSESSSPRSVQSNTLKK